MKHEIITKVEDGSLEICDTCYRVLTTIVVTKTYPLSGLKYSMLLNITMDQYNSWQNGELIEDAMPHINADAREWLMTGIPPEKPGVFGLFQELQHIELTPIVATKTPSLSGVEDTNMFALNAKLIIGILLIAALYLFLSPIMSPAQAPLFVHSSAMSIEPPRK